MLRSIFILAALACTCTLAAQQRTLIIESIYCDETEGWATCDNIYFKLSRDVTHRVGEMCENDTRYPNARFVFNNSITVEVWDDDTFDADDNLGRHTLSASNTGSSFQRTFDQDGAEYIVTFRITY